MTKRKTTRKVYWAGAYRGKVCTTYMFGETLMAIYSSKKMALRSYEEVIPVHIIPIKRKKL